MVLLNPRFTAVKHGYADNLSPRYRLAVEGRVSTSPTVAKGCVGMFLHLGASNCFQIPSDMNSIKQTLIPTG